MVRFSHPLPLYPTSQKVLKGTSLKTPSRKRNTEKICINPRSPKGAGISCHHPLASAEPTSVFPQVLTLLYKPIPSTVFQCQSLFLSMHTTYADTQNFLLQSVSADLCYWQAMYKSQVTRVCAARQPLTEKKFKKWRQREDWAEDKQADTLLSMLPPAPTVSPGCTYSGHHRTFTLKFCLTLKFCEQHWNYSVLFLFSHAVRCC